MKKRLDIVSLRQLERLWQEVEYAEEDTGNPINPVELAKLAALISIAESLARLADAQHDE